MSQITIFNDQQYLATCCARNTEALSLVQWDEAVPIYSACYNLKDQQRSTEQHYIHFFKVL